MIYEEEKVLEMLRSILPSRAGKAAKGELNTVRRNTRHKTKAALKKGDSDFDFDSKARRKTKYIVRDRRDADHLNHFIKWAISITKDMPIAKRYPYMERLVPNTLIGRHALTHIKDREEFVDPDKEQWYFPAPFNRGYLRNRKYDPPFRLDRSTLHDDLYEVITSPQEHKKLNNYIKKAHGWSHLVSPARQWNKEDVRVFGYQSVYTKCDECSVARTIKGISDIDSFINDIYATTKHREWLQAVTNFFKDRK